jgi:hypothetical protein
VTTQSLFSAKVNRILARTLRLLLLSIFVSTAIAQSMPGSYLSFVSCWEGRNVQDYPQSRSVKSTIIESTSGLRAYAVVTAEAGNRNCSNAVRLLVAKPGPSIRPRFWPRPVWHAGRKRNSSCRLVPERQETSGRNHRLGLRQRRRTEPGHTGLCFGKICCVMANHGQPSALFWRALSLQVLRHRLVFGINDPPGSGWLSQGMGRSPALRDTAYSLYLHARKGVPRLALPTVKRPPITDNR